MKNTTKTAYAIGIAALFTSVQAAQAANIAWTNAGDGTWTNTASWIGGVLPGTAPNDTALITGGDVATVSSAITSVNEVDINVRNSSVPATLTITANLNSINDINIATSGNPTANVISQSGGTVTASGVLSIGGAAGATAAYKLSGSGVLNLTQTGNNITVLVGDLGTLSVAGSATLSTMGNTVVAAGGTVSLDGSGASFLAGAVGPNRDFTMQTTAGLQFTLDTLGVGTIDVADKFTVHAASSVLSIDASLFAGTGTMDLVTYTSMVNTFAAGSISITGLDGGRTGSIGYDANSMNLAIIPEPSTFALLGMSLGALMLIRKRQRS